MGEILSEVGDIVFSIVVGYLGALEFFYVVRHIYHWTFRHSDRGQEPNDAESLQRLQENIRNAIDVTGLKEREAGTSVMQDDVLYRDGFRIDPDEEEIKQLKGRINAKEDQNERTKEITAELAKKKQIAQEIRKQLEEAEFEFERERLERAVSDKEDELINSQTILRAEEEERKRQQVIEKSEAEKEKDKEDYYERKILNAEEEQEEKERRREEKQNIDVIEETNKNKELRENEMKLLADEEKREVKEREANKREGQEVQYELENEKKLAEIEKNVEEENRKREEWEQAEIGNEQRRLEEARNARLAQFEIQIERDQDVERDNAQEKESDRRKEEWENADENVKLPATGSEKEDTEKEDEEEIGDSNNRENEEAFAEQELSLRETELEYERKQREMEEINDEYTENLLPTDEGTTDERFIDGIRDLEEDSFQKIIQAETEYELQQQQIEQIDEKFDSRTDEELLDKKFESSTGTKLFDELRDSEEDEEQDSYEKILEAEAEREHNQQETEKQFEEMSDSPIDKILLDESASEDATDKKAFDELRDSEEEAQYSFQKILQAEREHELQQRQIEQIEEKLDADILEYERKQKIKQENARKFLEAEEEMVELQKKMEEAVQKKHVPLIQQTSVVEEPCVRKEFKPLYEPDRMTQSVKTQFGQAANESYSINSKPLIFPNVAEDHPIAEPETPSDQSSLSTQISQDIPLGENNMGSLMEREEPDGEDNIPPIHYTDEYLRSLDGIKQRPLIREEGSRRRRAFKKRHSSGSSSSWDSRSSREEEIKMFTSLEEEEMKAGKKDGNDFTAIKYTSEPMLKVKGHHRRHKRSPAKDSKSSEDNIKSSLEMLDEENINPWGEVIPEHYKDSEFWKREKATSIDEEDNEMGHKETIQKEGRNESENVTADQIPNTSAFEEATKTQHEEVLKALQNESQSRRKTKTDENLDTSNVSTKDKNPNLFTSQNTEAVQISSASSNSPHSQHSPHIENVDHIEVDAETVIKGMNTLPNIKIEEATEGAAAKKESWRDQYGLLVEGISDFYDFTASVNPSRSRSTSRNVSRSTTPHSKSNSNTNIKNVSNEGMDKDIRIKNLVGRHDVTSQINDVYDDASDADGILIEKDKFDRDGDVGITHKLKDIADDRRERRRDNEQSAIPSTSSCGATDVNADVYAISKKNIISLVESLRSSDSLSPTSDQSLLEESDYQTDNPNYKLALDLSEVPLTSPESTEDESVKLPITEYSQDNMNSLVQSLRDERGNKSRSRSRSPLPTTGNLQRSLETRRIKRIQKNDEFFEKIANRSQSPTQREEVTPLSPTPSILVEPAEDRNTVDTKAEDVNNDDDDMCGLVESLGVAARARSRSRSKSPMRVPTEGNLRRSVEVRRNRLIQQNDEFFEQLRSQTPELVDSLTKEIGNEDESEISFDKVCHTDSLFDKEPTNICFDYQNSESKIKLNQCETITDDSDDIKTFSNESNSTNEINDNDVVEQLLLGATKSGLGTFTINEKFSPEMAKEIDENSENTQVPKSCKDKLKQLKCTPTTPDYDRSISVEWKDIQRIKEEILASGYNRSTYVGESMDLGSEYEDLRRIAAQFRRSPSRSRSIRNDDSDLIELARHNASEARRLQEKVLDELTTNSQEHHQGEDRHGAKPKTDFKKLPTSKHTRNDVMGYSYDGETLNLDCDEYEEMRRCAAEFRRSQSRSRSPIDDAFEETAELVAIDAEATRRGLQDQILDEIEQTTMHFKDFRKDLNMEFLDHERRSSDSAIVHKPEVIIQFQDNDMDDDLDPEEYHHFRRFSLHQELSQEEYPNDDYVCVSQIEVRTVSGIRTWTREDYYSDDFGPRSNPMQDLTTLHPKTPDDELEEEVHEMLEHFLEEEGESDGSEDDRRTVVDVEDEIEEDVNDFNEQGTADESHHEQSECEEAEREVDRYAGKKADDWKDPVATANDDGAMGGKDSDSFVIDEIYTEAIRDRKESGILKDFDDILENMQQSYAENDSKELNHDHDFIKIKSRRLGSNSSLNSIENERREGEWRYLGDVSAHARTSARLRSRYGYAPVPRVHDPVEEIETDLNYKPKREYNWRKNFKLEEEGNETLESKGNEKQENGFFENTDLVDDCDKSNEHKLHNNSDNIARSSRGFDTERSLEEELDAKDSTELEPETSSELTGTDVGQSLEGISKETQGPPKKKKNKRKLRIGSFPTECEDNPTVGEGGRETEIAAETKIENINSPKRKLRSRRASRNTLLSDDSLSVYSPQTASIDYPEPMEGFSGEYTETVDSASVQKVKTKKKRKGKTTETETSASQQSKINEVITDAMKTTDQLTTAANVSSSQTVQVVTVVETEEKKTKTERMSVPVPTTSSATSRVLDSLDILKDGNFYPLF